MNQIPGIISRTASIIFMKTMKEALTFQLFLLSAMNTHDKCIKLIYRHVQFYKNLGLSKKKNRRHGYNHGIRGMNGKGLLRQCDAAMTLLKSI